MILQREVLTQCKVYNLRVKNILLDSDQQWF